MPLVGTTTRYLGPASPSGTHRTGGRRAAPALTDSAPLLEKSLWGEGRPRLDRQEHAASEPRSRLLVFARRDFEHPSLAHRRPQHRRPLRLPQPLPKRLPHGRLPRTSAARRPTLPRLPNHREQRTYSGRPLPSPGQSHFRLRRLPASVPVHEVLKTHRGRGLRPAHASIVANSWSFSAGMKPLGPPVPPAARCAAPALKAGNAIWPWAWGMRPLILRSSPPFRNA